MSTQELSKLTSEELHQRAVLNYNALMFTTIEFLKQHQISILDYAAHVGKRFAEGWTPDLNALELAEGIAENMMSIGAKVEGLNGDQNESQLVIVGWPPADILENFSGSFEDTDQFLQIAGSISETEGFSFETTRQNDRVVIQFSRTNR